ncbi:hypothetical protein LAZ67_13000473 [Cordylochernes scorpioides]|uniref:Integrase zinc-binding domain-containing protein n=1 Tax=Cordylochernes scorpioides TaxID=51811 RepID=A0ABY6L301_9ARAC|nr:hypothetical protein LAZ67_13000473 [Cordylochernes scorpioides]
MPILLPSDHFLVSLLIRWNHETHGHAGLQTLLGILRENYWILRSRKTVKKIIDQCIHCKRFTASQHRVAMSTGCFVDVNWIFCRRQLDVLYSSTGCFVFINGCFVDISWMFCRCQLDVL